MFTRDKRSSLLIRSISDEEKMFDNVESRSKTPPGTSVKYRGRNVIRSYLKKASTGTS